MLKPKQRRAIDAVMTCKTLEAAAAEAKVTSKTLRAWMKKPDFAFELRKAEDELTAALRRRLAAGQDKALEALEAVIDAGNDANKRQAAAAWLEYRVKTVDSDIESRLTELERILKYGN